MKERDPLDDILNQIGGILDFAREKSSQPFSKELSPDIEQRLDQIEDMITSLNKIADEEMQKKGLSRKDALKKLFSEKETLPKRDQRLIEKSHQLNRDALGMKFALEAAQIKAKKDASKPFEAEKAKKVQVAKRKSKFKRMRGDQDWKKL